MAIFEAAYEATRSNEGGWTTDPHPTIFGIDRNGHPDWPYWDHVDAYLKAGKSPNLLAHDPIFMQQVRILYRQNYWPAAYNLIASQVAANMLFDRGVNMGVGQAVRIAQRVLDVPDDGSFGKVTLFHLNQMSGIEFCKKYDAACDEFYRELAKDPKYKRFKKSWINRK